jgi:hypothetical protein
LAVTLRDHLDGILAYCKHQVTNGVTEGINSTIMTIKRLAGGYRNIDNFKTAIYYSGGLFLNNVADCAYRGAWIINTMHGSWMHWGRKTFGGAWCTR